MPHPMVSQTHIHCSFKQLFPPCKIASTILFPVHITSMPELGGSSEASLFTPLPSTCVRLLLLPSGLELPFLPISICSYSSCAPSNPPPSFPLPPWHQNATYSSTFQVQDLLCRANIDFEHTVCSNWVIFCTANTVFWEHTMYLLGYTLYSWHCFGVHSMF